MNPNANRTADHAAAQIETQVRQGDDDLAGVVGRERRVAGREGEGDLAAEILDAAHRIAESEAEMLSVASAKVQRRRSEQIVEGRDKQDRALLNFFGRA